MSDEIIKFIRRKDFKFVKDLGRGGCGKAVLLYDDVIDEQFVCKKYEPYYEPHKLEFFKNFLHEIKILYLAHHQNICRIFGCYIYPERTTGYIMMEYIKGCDVEDYLKKMPENFNEIFFQAIEGFSYLEQHNILHRDIRSQNILVTDNGVLKIIDFGFGKKIDSEQDFDKSVSLNWWCTVPSEFGKKIYNFATEVYFVGKLFEKILTENGVECFKFKAILHRMCHINPDQRIGSFLEIKKEILNDKFQTLEFSDIEIECYRNFSSALHRCLAKIDERTKYFEDVNDVQSKLEELYKRVMLEDWIPENSAIIGCFINGTYSYYDRGFYVSYLKSFIEILRSCPKEKRNIILNNLHSKLDSVKRIKKDDDEIPF